MNSAPARPSAPLRVPVVMKALSPFAGRAGTRLSRGTRTVPNRPQRPNLLPIVGSLVALMAALLALSAPALAGVYLKPAGGGLAPLRQKSVEAEVAIVDHVADTRTTMVFANETSQRIEADFMMTLPPGAIVTYFAYWYGDEKVVAQILEKERAAAVYKHITTRQRDPALVEMIDKNTFRARVFPVMPNADLKVEIHFAQSLPTDRQGAFYTFPLMDEDEDQTPLDRIDLRFHVAPDPTLGDVRNNLGLPVESTDGGFTMALQGENYRPTKDLRLNLVPVSAPPGAMLYASVYAARSGEPDGYFALTIVPFRALTRPAVRIRGVRVYAVLPGDLSGVPAYGALHLFGRYRGTGPAVVEVRDGAWSGRVNFSLPTTNLAENPASKLWAAEQIAALSEKESNRDRVIALSKRHNIPSKFTSWLAVPSEEWKNYWREALQGDAEALAEQLSKEIDAGRGNTRKAREIRTTLNDYARRMGTTPVEFLQGAYRDRLQSLATPLATEEIEGRANGAKARNLRRQLGRIASQTGLDAKPLVESAYRDEASRRSWILAGKLAPYIVEEREDAPEAQRLQRELNAMARRAGQRPSDTLQSHLYSAGHSLSERLAKAEYEKQALPDTESLRGRLERIERAGGMEPGYFMRQARAGYEYQNANRIAEMLTDEIFAGRGEGETARSLRTELEDILQRTTVSRDVLTWRIESRLGQQTMQYVLAVEAGRETPQDLDALREHYERAKPYGGQNSETVSKRISDYTSWHLSDLGRALVVERHRPAPKPQTMADLEQRMARLSASLGKPAQDFMDENEAWYRTDPLERTRTQIIEERRKQSPNPVRLAALEAQFMRLQPRNEEYARARLLRIAAEIEMDRLDHIENPTDAQKARRADVARRLQEVRARMGDPLLQVDAPADALRVVALMPDGTVKPLAWNDGSRRWEARFDIPSWAAEGTYAVTVIVVRKDGARQALTIRYHVDLTPPAASGRARAVDGKTLRLEVEGSADTARVSALLPWGAEAAMGPSGSEGRFTALAPIPSDWTSPVTVTYILTDKAHNRTQVTVQADG